MSSGIESGGGWMISGFQAQVTLWIWTTLVLLYALIRSIGRPEPDDIRASGPTGLS